MKVILLVKIRSLGDIGQQVVVKPGYARNFLLPQGKAALATPVNVAKFEARRAELEKAAQEAHKAAEQRALKLQDLVVTIAVKAGEEGRLYGSVTHHDIAAAISKQAQVEVSKHEILTSSSIRQVGEYDVQIELHSDVICNIKLNVVAE